MGKTFETDFETIKQVIAPILKEKDERAEKAEGNLRVTMVSNKILQHDIEKLQEEIEKAEAQVKQQTSLLESCRKALVEAETRECNCEHGPWFDIHGKRAILAKKEAPR
jgi:flagellar biosynthesis chaperone FliJ